MCVRLFPRQYVDSRPNFCIFFSWSTVVLRTSDCWPDRLGCRWKYSPSSLLTRKCPTEKQKRWDYIIRNTALCWLHTDITFDSPLIRRLLISLWALLASSGFICLRRQAIFLAKRSYWSQDFRTVSLHCVDDIDPSFHTATSFFCTRHLICYF